jgi:hypothetical protein
MIAIQPSHGDASLIGRRKIHPPWRKPIKEDQVTRIFTMGVMVRVAREVG